MPRQNPSTTQIEPEGGWAPPRWKREITRPFHELQRGQGPIEGTIRNLEAFGAFVDIGSERDAFLHVSEISPEFVHQPSDLLRSGKKVQCWIQHVDENSGKLAVTLIPRKIGEKSLNEFEVGTVINGKIIRITSYGVFMDINAEVDAFMHSTKLPRRRNSASRMSLDDFVLGKSFKVRVTEVDEGRRRISVESVDKLPTQQERGRFAPPESVAHVFMRGTRP